MKVLIACEESQAVCVEFRKLGHEAYSADIQEPSGGHPDWHICGDVLPLINGGCSFQTMDGVKHDVKGKWDMLIAFPPCTYLSNAGNASLYSGGVLNEERYKKGLEAKAFFLSFLNCQPQGVIKINVAAVTERRNLMTYEENERAKLIEYITEELDKDLLESYETDFLRDLAKFIEEYGYI